MKKALADITPRQRLYMECRKVKVTRRGLERWDRKATIAAVKIHPLGRALFPELFDTEPNPALTSVDLQ